MSEGSVSPARSHSSS